MHTRKVHDAQRGDADGGLLHVAALEDQLEDGVGTGPGFDMRGVGVRTKPLFPDVELWAGCVLMHVVPAEHAAGLAHRREVLHVLQATDHLLRDVPHFAGRQWDSA